MHTKEVSKLCAQARVQALCTKGFKLCAQKAQSSVHRQGFSSVHTRAQALCTGRGSKLCVQARVQALCTGRGSKLCAQKGSALCTHRRIPGSVHRQGFSSVHTRAQALCTRRRIPSSVYTQEDSKLCVHTGGFRALCTRRRIPGSVHTRAQALCTGKGPSSVHTRAQALCTGRGSKLCAQAGLKLCAQKAQSSVHTQEDSKLCAHAGGLLVKNRVFELSDRTSLSSTVFYNPLPRHTHGKSNSFSASLGAKSILEKGLSTYFAESPLDFSVFLDFKSAKSTSVHREHLQKRLYPAFRPEPVLQHQLLPSPSDCFCTVAGYNFALKSA